MVNLALENEQVALETAATDLFARHSTIEQVRATEDVGFDDALWKEVVATGFPTISVAEERDGGGGSVIDAAIVTGRLGAHLAPVPLIEAITSANLLSQFAGTEEILAEINGGELITTLSLAPTHGRRARRVPAGAVAGLLVTLVGDELVMVRRDGSSPGPGTTRNLGSQPIADWDLETPTVLAAGADAVQAFRGAVSQWRVLMASALCGLAETALKIGVDYVRERHAFGVPLAWFQVIQHRLADAATDIDGARMLTWEAAWARSVDDPRAPALATMSLLAAQDAAFAACRESLQFHGGYGYTLEYDIQMFFRRAKAWPMAAGPKATLFAELADDLYGPKGGSF